MKNNFTVRETLLEAKKRIEEFKCVTCNSQDNCAQGFPIAQLLGGIAVQIDEMTVDRGDAAMNKLMETQGELAGTATVKTLTAAIAGAFIAWLVGAVIPQKLINVEGVIASLMYELDIKEEFDWQEVMKLVEKKKKRGASDIFESKIKEHEK